MFSSHNLNIVQKICDRAIIINNGNLVANLDIELEVIIEKSFLKIISGYDKFFFVFVNDE